MNAPRERDILARVTGRITLPELYALIEGTPAAERDGGLDIVHGRADTRWRRRLRGALQSMRRRGMAERVGDGVWIVHGTSHQPRTAVLVSASGRDIELRVQTAVELLQELDEPADLVFADPPYGLDQGRGDRHDVAARTSAAIDREAHIVPGYVDVPAADYAAFTAQWVGAAVGAVRPGGYLCVVTGPQQAAWVQVSAELAGFSYVNSVSIGKVFALRATRRFAHAHWTATILCRGPLDSQRRVFTPPHDLPKARSGVDYPQDIWPIGSVGRVQRRAGVTRYRNELPSVLVRRLFVALTRPPTPQQADLVVEPFLGGGTGAGVAQELGVRYIGADINPFSIPFVMHRLDSARGGPGVSQLDNGNPA